MAPTVAHPPTIIHHSTTKQVSLRDAQKLISSYLAASTRKPHLHPDAVLTTSGPTFSVQAGRQGGLVLHQLRRVEAGLRGEILQPDPKALLLGGNVTEQINDVGADDDAMQLDVPGAADGGDTEAGGATNGDDSRLDALIAEAEQAMQDEQRQEARVASSQGTPKKLKSSLKRKATALADGGQAGLTSSEPNSQELATNRWQDPDEFAREQGNDEVGEMQRHSNVVGDIGRVQPALNGGPVDKAARKQAKKERNKADKRKRALEKQNSGAVLSSDKRVGDKGVNGGLPQKRSVTAEISTVTSARSDKNADKEARKQAKKERKEKERAEKQEKENVQQNGTSSTKNIAKESKQPNRANGLPAALLATLKKKTDAGEKKVESTVGVEQTPTQRDDESGRKENSQKRKRDKTDKEGSEKKKKRKKEHSEAG